MPRWPLIASVLAPLLGHAAAAPAQGPVQLDLAPEEPRIASAYQDAVLSVANPTARTVRAVSVRMPQGGPTWLWALTVPPESNALLPVTVPVNAPEQAYRLEALAGDDPRAERLAAAQAVISWPPEALSARPFIDPDLYRPYEARAAPWPSADRGRVLALAALGASLLAGTLLIRRPAVRLAAAGAVIAGAAAAMVVALGAPAVQVRYVYSQAPSGMGRNALVPAYILLTCRRTAEWTAPRAELIPAYPTAEAMAADNAVVSPSGGLRLTMAPGELRIFRIPPRPPARLPTPATAAN